MKVKIKRLDPTVELPRYQTDESAAFDLATSESAQLQPKEIKLLHTGLIIEAPPGHFLLISARSSLPLKKKLMIAQGIGVVGRTYSGPDDEKHPQGFNFFVKIIQ